MDYIVGFLKWGYCQIIHCKPAALFSCDKQSMAAQEASVAAVVAEVLVQWWDLTTQKC